MPRAKWAQLSGSWMDLRVANLDGEHDAAAIERGLENFRGLVELKVYANSARVTVAYKPVATEPKALKEKLQSHPAREGREMAGPPPPG